MSVLADLGASRSDLLVAVTSTVGVYVVVIVLTRWSGPRSLAKMSSFDFAATIAVGSTVASTATGGTSLVTGAFALLLLYLLQYVVARLRQRGLLGGLVDNEPLALVLDGEVLSLNLAAAGISQGELWAQLRLSGVRSRAQVRAVVLETTGDLSVVTGDDPVDEDLLKGVRIHP